MVKSLTEPDRHKTKVPSSTNSAAVKNSQSSHSTVKQETNSGKEEPASEMKLPTGGVKSPDDEVKPADEAKLTADEVKSAAVSVRVQCIIIVYLCACKQALHMATSIVGGEHRGGETEW